MRLASQGQVLYFVQNLSPFYFVKARFAHRPARRPLMVNYKNTHHNKYENYFWAARYCGCQVNSLVQKTVKLLWVAY
jgi:hypothetical protein